MSNDKMTAEDLEALSIGRKILMLGYTDPITFWEEDGTKRELIYQPAEYEAGITSSGYQTEDDYIQTQRHAGAEAMKAKCLEELEITLKLAISKEVEIRVIDLIRIIKVLPTEDC